MWLAHPCLGNYSVSSTANRRSDHVKLDILSLYPRVLLCHLYLNFSSWIRGAMDPTAAVGATKDLFWTCLAQAGTLLPNKDGWMGDCQAGAVRVLQPRSPGASPRCIIGDAWGCIVDGNRGPEIGPQIPAGACMYYTPSRPLHRIHVPPRPRSHCASHVLTLEKCRTAISGCGARGCESTKIGSELGQ